MRKSFFTLLIALLVNVNSFAQEKASIEWKKGQSASLNLRDVNSFNALMKKAQGMDRYNVRQHDGSTYKWIDRIESLPSYMNNFYNTYKQAKESALEGKENWLFSPDNAPCEYNSLKYVNVRAINVELPFYFAIGASQDQITSAARQVYSSAANNYWNEFTNYMPYLCMCIDYDNPDCFWSGNHFQWGYLYSASYSWWPNRGEGLVTLEMDLYLSLKDNNFCYVIDAFDDSDILRDEVKEFRNVVDQLTTEVEGKSRYAQLNYFDTWLTTHNYYNPCYVQGGDNNPLVWSPYSSLFGKEDECAPVCESYARAFKVLCDRLDIPCMVVSGHAGPTKYSATEPHMWNLVQMEDERWYAVDVTWDDPMTSNNYSKKSGYENKNWFLLCQQDRPSQNYTFDETHVAGITWDNVTQQHLRLWDLMNLPSLSETPYDPDWEDGIDIASAKPEGLKLNVYTLEGQNLGTFRSLSDMKAKVGKAGIYVMDGKKVYVK